MFFTHRIRQIIHNGTPKLLTARDVILATLFKSAPNRLVTIFEYPYGQMDIEHTAREALHNCSLDVLVHYVQEHPERVPESIRNFWPIGYKILKRASRLVPYYLRSNGRFISDEYYEDLRDAYKHVADHPKSHFRAIPSDLQRLVHRHLIVVCSSVGDDDIVYYRARILGSSKGQYCLEYKNNNHQVLIPFKGARYCTIYRYSNGDYAYRFDGTKVLNVPPGSTFATNRTKSVVTEAKFNASLGAHLDEFKLNLSYIL